MQGHPLYFNTEMPKYPSIPYYIPQSQEIQQTLDMQRSKVNVNSIKMGGKQVIPMTYMPSMFNAPQQLNKSTAGHTLNDSQSFKLNSSLNAQPEKSRPYQSMMLEINSPHAQKSQVLKPFPLTSTNKLQTSQANNPFFRLASHAPAQVQQPRLYQPISHMHTLSKDSLPLNSLANSFNPSKPHPQLGQQLRTQPKIFASEDFRHPLSSQLSSISKCNDFASPNAKSFVL